MSHYEERLEQDLARLRSQLRSMGETVLTQIEDCGKALFVRDHSLANQIVIKDAITNRDMRKIDRLCYAFIARHIPSGGVLRLVASIIRVTIQLERVGDYLVTVARSVRRLEKPPAGIILRELQSLIDESRRMLDQALTAFDTDDDALAVATAQMHAHLENTLDDVYEELFSDMGQRSNREIMSFFVIFNMLKRIADQAKNISEQTVFSVTGEAKGTKRYRILFLDRDQSRLAPMAVAIAGRAHGDSGIYLSAGQEVAEFSSSTSTFLSDKGIEVAVEDRAALEQLGPNLGDADIVVSLQGEVSEYLEDIPFHTAAFDWEIGESGSDPDNETAYREISSRLADLMAIISGSED
ncbi:MAG: phosphate signaling complex protein PhoU [Xanthomonadales bacterium]|nr:phosphate signaling complex protein PhoU [Xanthomonadales bacterium]